MLKRTIPVLFAVVVLFTVAVPAKADHCARCKFTIDTQYCIYNAAFGRTECDDFTGVCQTFGDPCNHQTAAVTPLSTEFAVASVERIDEAPAPNQALVAQLDAPKPVADPTR